MVYQNPRSNGGVSLEGALEEGQQLIPSVYASGNTGGVSLNLMFGICDRDAFVSYDHQIGRHAGKPGQNVIGRNLPDILRHQSLLQCRFPNDLQSVSDVGHELLGFIKIVQSTVKLLQETSDPPDTDFITGHATHP